MDELDITYNNLLNNSQFQISDSLLKRKILNKYLMSLLSFRVNEDEIRLSSLEAKEFSSLLEECFNDIFLNKNDLTFFDSLTKKIEVSSFKDMNGSIYFGGYLSNNQYKMFLISLTILYVPSFEGICAIMHEYAHAKELEHYPVYNNIYNKELFAILVELMTSINIDNILGNDSISLNQQLLRLYYTSKDTRDYFFGSNITNNVSRFTEMNNLNYIISNIYALLLSDYYRYYPNNFMKQFVKIIEGEIKIEDLINYYGIQLESKDSLYVVNKKIKKITKL